MNSKFINYSTKKNIILIFIFIVFVIASFIYLPFFNVSFESIMAYGHVFSIKYVVCFVLIYLLSHIMRILRLYILLLEEKIKWKQLLRIYFITTFVNFVLPFKIGEIYRIIEIGTLCNNIRRGIITIWIERFFDAVVLLVLSTCYLIYIDNASYNFIPVYILLLVFSGLSVLFYVEFRHSFNYLNQFIVSKSNTSKGVRILKFLENLKMIHSDIKRLIVGRTTMLILLSILIWCIELIAIYFLAQMININSIVQSFILLINEPFKSQTEFNFELITIYKNFAFLILFLIASPYILITFKRRYSEARKFKNKNNHGKYIKIDDL